MSKIVRYSGVVALIFAFCAVLGVLFVSPYAVNDGYNLVATLYLGKVCWVVLIVALIMGVLKKEFFARCVTDLIVLALAMMLYLHSGSLELYKEQIILLLLSVNDLQ